MELKYEENIDRAEMRLKVHKLVDKAKRMMAH